MTEHSTMVATTSEHYMATGREDGSILIQKTRGPHDEAEGRGGIISAKEARALKYVFQDQKDIDLGRWRSEVKGWMVVYPQVGSDLVLVLNELDGTTRLFERDEVARGQVILNDYEHTARAYYNAHPLPKPWQNAKNNEVWELEFSDGTKGAFIMNATHLAGAVFGNAETYLLTNSDNIVGGKRLYPQEK